MIMEFYVMEPLEIYLNANVNKVIKNKIMMIIIIRIVVNKF